MNERRWNSGQTGGRTRYAQFLSLSCLKIHFFITTQQCRGQFSPPRHPVLTRRVGVPTRGAFPSSFCVLFDAMRRDVPLRRVFPFSMRRISPPRRVTLYLTRREGISPRCVVFYLGERHGHAMYAHLYFFLSFFLTRMTAGTTTRGYYPPHTIANTTPSPPSTFHRHPHHHQRQCQCRPRRPHHHEKGHPFLARKDASVGCPANTTRQLLKVFCRARHHSAPFE